MESYDETVDDWDSYSERLIQFFQANDIGENKKVPALLSVTGSKTYRLLKNLTASEKPHEKNFDGLVESLWKHFAPKPLKIAERYRFRK